MIVVKPLGSLSVPISMPSLAPYISSPTPVASPPMPAPSPYIYTAPKAVYTAPLVAPATVAMPVSSPTVKQEGQISTSLQSFIAPSSILQTLAPSLSLGPSPTAKLEPTMMNPAPVAAQVANPYSVFENAEKNTGDSPMAGSGTPYDGKVYQAPPVPQQVTKAGEILQTVVSPDGGTINGQTLQQTASQAMSDVQKQGGFFDTWWKPALVAVGVAGVGYWLLKK